MLPPFTVQLCSSMRTETCQTATCALSTGRFSAARPATPPDGAAERATSQPPESAPDEKLRLAAARHAMSARLPDVRPMPPLAWLPAVQLWPAKCLACCKAVHLCPACSW